MVLLFVTGSRVMQSSLPSEPDSFQTYCNKNATRTGDREYSRTVITRVDPLTSILAVLVRSCQILTTSWQPWIPWQDSYQDLTKIILIPRSYLITMDKILRL